MINFYFLLFLFVSICNAGCGVFTGASGNIYDLDPLTTTKDYTGKEQSTTYSYYYNYCQNVNISSCTPPAPSVQISATGTCTPIGFLPPNITEISEGKLAIVYTSTISLCGNPKSIPRVATFLLSCNPNVEYTLVEISEPGICQYVFTVQTKYACPGNQGNKSDCCTPQANPGCSDLAVQECVCAAQPDCCTSNWNSTCVGLVNSLGCGNCTLGPCCTAHEGEGCADRAVSICVCENMEECCTNEWTSDCVNAVSKYNCGAPCSGSCCTANQPCMDKGVRDCVCKRDVYCCHVQWDAKCVEEAQQLNCTVCPNPTPKPSPPQHFIGKF